jgi:predicted ATPase/DNA-binding SARP family transcriptional activator
MVPTLHIHLLGEFRLSAGDTPVTTLDQERLQALLSYLVLQRAAPQSRQQLAFQLWPDSTESQARTNLRSLIHRLRQALPHADAFVHSDGQMVQWRADSPCTMDVATFEQALARAAQDGQRGDQTRARCALQQAVELYRGDLLPALYDDWVLRERERLRQEFVAALERLIVLLELAGDYPAAIGYAQQLLRHDPLHESTYQHLMRLHALSGDRASAVRVYQTCLTVLERELGVEPSPATHEAYERVLHLDVAALAVERPAPPTPYRQQYNLPLALTSFIGRTREIGEVTRLLATTRLLTLTGAGGCGKTRLALAVAAELVAAYPDGVWLVELAALADGVLVPQAVATVLGVQEQAQRPLTATLVDALRPRDLLLVLDNCEHLIDACAHLAQSLLVGCAQLRILATSREALGIAGETTWLVPSLPLPDMQQLPPVAELAQVEAVRLFAERAAAALPTFTLTPANMAMVAQICGRLDGIPLAIELAAARVKVVSVDQLATRLDDCVRLLAGGSRTALPRQQTLRAAIDWSYNLLSEEERALFRRVAVFAGGWTLEAVEVVCAAAEISSAAVLELLAHLVDKSLVVVEPPREGQVRYRLLEPIRQYALEKLRGVEEAAAIRRQHALFFLALAEAAEPKLQGPEQALWLDRLAAEHDNLRAALRCMLDQTEGEITLRLSGALWHFWYTHGFVSEGRRWLEDALTTTCTPRGSPRQWMAVRAKALYGASVLAEEQADYTQTVALCEQSLALFRNLGDQTGAAHSLVGLGRVMMSQGDQQRAEMLLEESLALFRDMGDQEGITRSLYCLGLVALAQDKLQQARSLFEESLALQRALGDKKSIFWLVNGLGEVARCQGDDARAEACYSECLLLAQEVGFKRGTASVLHDLGQVALARGDYARAALRFAESLAMFQALGHKQGIAHCLAGVAGLASAVGQPERAAQVFGAMEALLDATNLILVPADHMAYSRNLAHARSHLDADAFAAAWAVGRALPLEQAVAEALRVTDEVMVQGAATFHQA